MWFTHSLASFPAWDCLYMLPMLVCAVVHISSHGCSVLSGELSSVQDGFWTAILLHGGPRTVFTGHHLLCLGFLMSHPGHRQTVITFRRPT